MVIIPKHTAVARTTFGHLMYPRMDVKVQNRYFFYNVFFFPNSVNLTIINKLLLPVAIRLTDSLCYYLKLLAKFLYKLNITFTSILGYIRWPNIVLVTAVCFGIITIYWLLLSSLNLERKKHYKKNIYFDHYRLHVLLYIHVYLSFKKFKTTLNEVAIW
jgi:hypothetical protein